MKITVTMDLTPENLEKLKALCLDGEAEVTETPKQEVTPKTATSPKKAPENEAPVPAEPEPEAPVSSNITKEDIRAIATAVSDAGKKKELLATFAKFGAKKLSDFDSRPEDYPALMEALVSLNG